MKNRNLPDMAAERERARAEQLARVEASAERADEAALHAERTAEQRRADAQERIRARLEEKG